MINISCFRTIIYTFLIRNIIFKKQKVADVLATMCALAEEYSIYTPAVSLGLWKGEFLKSWDNRKRWRCEGRGWKGLSFSSLFLLYLFSVVQCFWPSLARCLVPISSAKSLKQNLVVFRHQVVCREMGASGETESLHLVTDGLICFLRQAWLAVLALPRGLSARRRGEPCRALPVATTPSPARWSGAAAAFHPQELGLMGSTTPGCRGGGLPVPVSYKGCINLGFDNQNPTALGHLCLPC